MTNLPAALKSEQFAKAGLNPYEVELAMQWKRPLNPQNLERARELFMRGYSCESIVSKYSEYNMPYLLAARATYGWDQQRQMQAQQKAMDSLAEAAYAQPEGLAFMNKIISIVNKKYEKAMLDYITDPERAPFPEVSKADFERIEHAIQLSRDILGLTKASKETAKAGASAVVNIILKNHKGSGPATVELDQDLIAEEMIRELEEAEAEDAKKAD